MPETTVANIGELEEEGKRSSEIVHGLKDLIRAMQQEDDHQPVLFAHSLMFWQGTLCFHPSASI